MTTSSEKDEVLARLLAMASAKWGSKETDSMRSSLEAAAQAIRAVDAFQVPPDEEPNPNPMRSHLSVRGKLK